MTKKAVENRRPLSVLLASVITGAVVLLVTGGIAFGSSSSAQYEYGHPVPTAPPAISGTAQVGQKLTTSNGTWTSDSKITLYSYTWGRCDTAGNNCTGIGGATSNTYTLTTDDQGHTIRSYVTATNSNGTTQEHSNQTAVVAAAPVTTGKQIAASTVTLPNRLIIDQTKYSQSPIRSRHSPTQMKIHVSDSHNNSVANALVYVEGLPYSRVAVMPEVTTDATGWATVNIQPAQFFPRTGYLVMFVRARVPGQDVLAGASTRRLVQVTIGTPNGT
jgi:hypothetical protein